MNPRRWLLACAWLSACSTLPSPRPSTADVWSGRLGLQDASGQQWHAAFELQGSAQQGELILLSPLGSTLARLRWDSQQAVLERGQQRWQQANVEQLSQQLTGTALPMGLLFDWLQAKATSAEGWLPDLSGLGEGRILARRESPAPAVNLRIVLDR